MTRFTLVIEPDGRALLVTPDDLTEDMLHQIEEAWERWRDSDKAVAILANTDIKQVRRVELDLHLVSN